jgi:hypothetical protein
MKTLGLLLLVILSAAFHVSAGNTNLSSTVSVDKPLAIVRAALIVFCANPTNEPGIYVFRTNDVPGVQYGVSVMDCTFDTSSGPLQGEIVATSLTTGTTRLELRTDNPPAADIVRAAREKRHVSRILKQIAEMSKEEP